MSVPMLRVTRLDFPNTIDVMLSLCDDFLDKVPPAKKKGVEDVIFCLNTAAKAIESYDLADHLTPPRPGSPRPEPQPKPAAQPVAVQPADDKPTADLTDRQSAILAYLRTHPGCTVEEIASATASTSSGITQCVYYLRKVGHAIRSQRAARRGDPGRYFLENAQSNGHAPT